MTREPTHLAQPTSIFAYAMLREPYSFIQNTFSEVILNSNDLKISIDLEKVMIRVIHVVFEGDDDDW